MSIIVTRACVLFSKSVMKSMGAVNKHMVSIATDAVGGLPPAWGAGATARTKFSKKPTAIETGERQENVL